MGLGLLGRGVNVAKFLAECGAELTVTDLKSEEELAPSLRLLKAYPTTELSRLPRFSPQHPVFSRRSASLRSSSTPDVFPKSGKREDLPPIRFVLGRHRLEDFREADMVIKAAGVPLDSPFTAEAHRCGVPVKMDASLFAELAPEGVVLVGVTGTRGKSTTTQLLYEVLSAQCSAVGARSDEQRPDTRYKIQDTKQPRTPRVFLGGNVRGTATLPLLKKVRPGDIVVLELDSWQLQGFGEAKISPHVAVFTTFFDDHLNYYGGDRGRYLNDKANIFTHQGGVNNFQFSIFNFQTRPVLIVGEQAARLIRTHFPEHAKRMVVARSSNVPEDWKLAIPGEHNRANAASALAAADALGVPRAISKRVITSFRGLPGRLELVRELRGVKIYNDTCATTPEATIAALRALGGRRQQKNQKPETRNQKPRPLILIMGGADKGLDMSALLKEIPRYCKAVVLLSGTGTRRLLEIGNWKLKILTTAHTLREAVASALSRAAKGDIVLFSPAFASFGMFKNEYDRGERFNRAVQGLR